VNSTTSALHEPLETELKRLQTLAADVRDRWIAQARRRSFGDPDIRPVVIEFAGSPRAGKSSTIEVVEHFFRRCGFRVFAQTEGASKRTPSSLKDDLVAFNAWSLNYAISELLVAFNSVERYNIILLDRGPFDALAWMRLLEAEEKLSPTDRVAIERYALLPKWVGMIDVAFLFTCDPNTSLSRELARMLTSTPGRAMNQETLGQLLGHYGDVQRELESKYRVEAFDTTTGTSPKSMAFRVASEILAIAEGRLVADVTSTSIDETVVVVPRESLLHWVRTSCLWTSESDSKPIQDVIRLQARVTERSAAESNEEVVQLIAYCLIRSGDSILCLRRADSEKRPELRGRLTILFGGHVDARDLSENGDFVRRALRRELREELQLELPDTTDFVGFVTETASLVGRLHLGVVFQMMIPAPELVVSQAADLSDYFGEDRGRRLEFRPLKWIQTRTSELDPWSTTVFASLLAPTLGT
jgi:predicted NUDIX family phosphoesterase